MLTYSCPREGNMKKKSFLAIPLILCLFAVVSIGFSQEEINTYLNKSSEGLEPIGTAFTYQGRLKRAGLDANGRYKFQFSLYDEPIGGNIIGEPIVQMVNVIDGIFTVKLDFGDAFNGDVRYLEISIRPESVDRIDKSFTLLEPRQEITAVPYALTATKTILPEEKLAYFTEHQSITTIGNVDWKFFSIDNNYYLASANHHDGVTYNVNSEIYKWDGTNFVPFQSLSTTGANDEEFFTIDGTHYLAITNYSSDSSFNIDSEIYTWNGTEFILYQTIPTNGAADWEYFTINNDHYLAVANYRNDSTRNIDSKIYKWDGSYFILEQSIPTHGARDWQHFIIGEDHYLAVANHHNDSLHSINSEIYKWNGSNFTPVQTIPTIGIYDWEFFTINGNHYLASANYRNDSIFDINSEIYKWNGSSFIPYQSIPTIGAVSWQSFTIGNEHYLAVANKYDGSSYNLNSELYKWDGISFTPIQSVPTNGARSWEYFTLNGEHYLALANRYDDFNDILYSKIYKAVLNDVWVRNGTNIYYNYGNVGIGTTNPQSALEIEGYIQLDVITTAPPANDCDEVSERGRMQVDTVASILYICTDSGWVTK